MYFMNMYVFISLVFAGMICLFFSLSYLSLSIITCSILIIIVRRSNYKNQSRNYRLPPGPNGLPVLGNLHMLGDLPHQNLHKLALKHGPIMYIRLGQVPAIVVSSPEMAELFLKTHDIIFASRPRAQVAEYITYGLKDLALAPYSSYWRNLRKLCTSHLLSNSKVDSFRSMRTEEVKIFVESIRVAAESGESVNLREKVGSLTEDITYRMVFGAKDDDKFNSKPIIREALGIVGAFNLADYVPYIGALDLQGLTRRMKAVSKAADKFFNKIIDQHVRDARNKQEHHRDFIDIMLTLTNVEKDDKGEQLIDLSSIKAIMWDMLVGAIDSSATTIEWALSELLRHPRVMKLVQEELETVVGLDRLVEETDLVKLEYLEMVLKESMRLHPPGPLLVPRESMEDIKINGYDIPKKSRVFVNIWAIGRDQQVWSKNAEEFYPERFIGSDIDMKGHNFRLIPFGSGRRVCPGIQMGLTMVRLILAQMVHCFNWVLPNGMSPQTLDMSEKFGLSVPRAKHLIAVPNYRLTMQL